MLIFSICNIRTTRSGSKKKLWEFPVCRNHLWILSFCHYRQTADWRWVGNVGIKSFEILIKFDFIYFVILIADSILSGLSILLFQHASPSSICPMFFIIFLVSFSGYLQRFLTIKRPLTSKKYGYQSFCTQNFMTIPPVIVYNQRSNQKCLF